MARETTTARDIRAEKGFRGARLGAPYLYRWVDQEPSKNTFKDLANKQGCMTVLIGFPVCAALAWLLGGVGVFSVVMLLVAYVVSILFAFGSGSAGRSDDEPVPKPVQREAYIEFAEGDFYFVLEVDGKPEIWQPWDLVRQFEKVGYWPMFGDAGKSPYNTGWHAITMTPLVGKPWLIGSTIEGEADVRERFTELDARFSADSRARFMRAYEARKSGVIRPSSTDGGSAPHLRASDVPEKL